LGVDESSLLSVITQWRKQPEKRQGFRSSSPFFKPHGSFERCEDDFVRSLKVEFARFKLLVGLVSAYRYEGSRVDDDVAKSEAKALGHAIKSAGTEDPVENYEVIRILTTRSKAHLKETFRHYNGLYGKSIEQDFAGESCLGETVQCLGSSASYFSKVIDKAFREEADKNAKDALTRVVVSRSDVDIEEIKAVYEQQHKAKLEDKIVKNTRGNYRDALLSLVGV
ncbi:hypothetical protein GW17_00045124, partial [Ensete ventricosum]